MRWMTPKKRFNRCGELATVWPELQDWYATGLGQQLAMRERDLLQATLANQFGYYLAQIGRLDSADWLSGSRVSQRFVLDFSSAPPVVPARADLAALPQQLPLKTDSIDIVVLPHVLEFSQYPHEVLREVERVLIPEGHLILLAFNPWSLWSIWSRLTRWRSTNAPWCARFLGTTRLRDWLALLGFDVLTVQGYFFHLPIQSDAIIQPMNFWERVGQRFWPLLGAANILVARKRVSALTPIRPSWTPQTIVSPGLKPYQNREPQQRRYG